MVRPYPNLTYGGGSAGVEELEKASEKQPKHHLCLHLASCMDTGEKEGEGHSPLASPTPATKLNYGAVESSRGFPHITESGADDLSHHSEMSSYPFCTPSSIALTACSNLFNQGSGLSHDILGDAP